MLAESVSQSVFYQVLNTVSDYVFNREMMFYLKKVRISRSRFFDVARVYQKCQQDIQTNWIPEFPILSALKNYLHVD